MIAAAGDFAKHGVLTVQPTGCAVVWNQEELAPSSVSGTGLGHRDGTGFVIETVIRFIRDGVRGLAWTLCLRYLIAVAVAKPLGSVAAGAVTVGEVATLNHEVINDTMEDGPVIIPVLYEEFEILHVNRRIVRIEFNGDRPAVGTTVPRQLEVDDIGGGPGPIGDVDHRQHQHASQEDGHDTGRRRRAVVEEARKGRLADAFVLHFIEQVVVKAVGFFVSRVPFGGFPKERSGSSVLSTVVTSFGLKPCSMPGQHERRGLFPVRIDIPENFQG